jgi:hypothetical protein
MVGCCVKGQQDASTRSLLPSTAVVVVFVVLIAPFAVLGAVPAMTAAHAKFAKINASLLRPILRTAAHVGMPAQAAISASAGNAAVSARYNAVTAFVQIPAQTPPIVEPVTTLASKESFASQAPANARKDGCNATANASTHKTIPNTAALAEMPVQKGEAASLGNATASLGRAFVKADAWMSPSIPNIAVDAITTAHPIKSASMDFVLAPKGRRIAMVSV